MENIWGNFGYYTRTVFLIRWKEKWAFHPHVEIRSKRYLIYQRVGKGYPLPYIIKGNDVSFSGLLSAVKTLLNDNDNDIHDICFSLQETAFSIIVEAVERALAFTGNKEFLIVGGVSANKRLSNMLETACDIHDSNFNSCPQRFCGDNGAQIAWTGAQMYLSRPSSSVKPENASVNQSWRLDRRTYSMEVTS